MVTSQRAGLIPSPFLHLHNKLSKWRSRDLNGLYKMGLLLTRWRAVLDNSISKRTRSSNQIASRRPILQSSDKSVC